MSTPIETPIEVRLRYRNTHIIVNATGDPAEPYTITITDLLGRTPNAEESDAALEWLLVSVSRLRDLAYHRLGRKPRQRPA